MRTTDTYKSIFENKLKYRYKSYSSSFERATEKNERQDFVVPWQMVKANEKKFLVD